jgi:hypothetical protein
LTSGDHSDILGVVNCNDGAGSEDQLLPGLLEVEDVVTYTKEGKGKETDYREFEKKRRKIKATIWSALPNVSFHVRIKVVGAAMNLASQHHLDVLRTGLQCRRILSHGSEGEE